MKGFNRIANAKISLCDVKGLECVDRLTGLKWIQRDPARREILLFASHLPSRETRISLSLWEFARACQSKERVNKNRAGVSEARDENPGLKHVNYAGKYHVNAICYARGTRGVGLKTFSSKTVWINLLYWGMGATTEGMAKGYNVHEYSRLRTRLISHRIASCRHSNNIRYTCRIIPDFEIRERTRKINMCVKFRAGLYFARRSCKFFNLFQMLNNSGAMPHCD